MPGKFNLHELVLSENIIDIFYKVSSSRGEVLVVRTEVENSVLFSLNN